MHLIGTDEAGYGPNLGPLVISATVWRVADGTGTDNLYDLLSDSVCSDPTVAARDGRLAITDSKALYQSGGSLAALERTVLALVGLRDAPPTDWRSVFERFDPAATKVLAQLPWYRDFELAVPVVADPADIAAATESLRRALLRTDITLSQVRSRVLFAPEFNDQVDQCDNKAVVLSQTTLSLVADLAGAIGDGPIRISCDKHGGRNKYAGLLQPLTGSELVQVVRESRAESRYRFGPASRRIDIRFVAKGERYLPAAAASIVSKYLRELAMLAFNRYWCDRVDGLNSTAGYPTDAKRWFASTEAAREKLQVDDQIIWRCR